jgi:hypothetical protein
LKNTSLLGRQLAAGRAETRIRPTTHRANLSRPRTLRLESCHVELGFRRRESWHGEVRFDSSAVTPSSGFDSRAVTPSCVSTRALPSVA